MRIERITKNEMLVLSLYAAGVAWLLFALSGCGSTTGWSVQFGVTPITAVHDEQGLNTGELGVKRFDFAQTPQPRM